MKTILVATDYSEPAENAVNFAANIARETDAELILFNVFKPSIHASNSMASSEDIQHLKNLNEVKLIEVAMEIKDQFDITVFWEVAEADTIESLKNYTANHPVDLVVMGIESNKTEYKIFGNTTTGAIKLMQFPLLVVPNDVNFEGIQRIIYACETTYLKPDCQLNLIKEFVQNFNSELEVLHILTQKSEANGANNADLEHLMNSILGDLNHTFAFHHNENVDDGIIERLSEKPADLLIMIPHKLKFLESMFVGSRTGQMTVKTRVPLLVIPNSVAC